MRRHFTRRGGPAGRFRASTWGGEDGALKLRGQAGHLCKGESVGGRNGRLVTHRGTDQVSVNTRDNGNRCVTVGERSYRYTGGKNQVGLCGTGSITVKSWLSTQIWK